MRRPLWLSLAYALLAVAGATLLWLPFHTQSALDDWGVTLRERGTPARATVVDQVTESGGNKGSSSSTMYFSYVVEGRTHAQEVPCFEVCRAAGAEVPIWVNPADPGDFVTDFGQLSGHRGRVQGVLGVVGLAALGAGVVLTLSRIRRAARPGHDRAARPGRDRAVRLRRVAPAPVGDGRLYTGRGKRKRNVRR
ncbi:MULTISPECIES: DUF3592 domain-containing protein [unclassified Micromonospora]|uniref:DUF3592 domain-containing protein n=1 Tax=unclassified Micromonospora TaxID=2617518 RepID=UPI00188F8839|nr:MULTISPECIES: DUF3592 domain-containing protein [unclassified Micromonospora]MBF5028713.1 DUF3592 domain-containing protein [Micromonospora sp. ANENR4]MCZ7472814.1 DUF3592 domain-containing protein [Micromonospora sp. WMMC273]WBC06293.1 DUF3592 domain-containing protein [Micromonospora sp. WMMA1976]